VNQQSEHLSDAQIEDYGDLPSGAGPDTEGKVEQHLAECSSCRSRLLDFQRSHMGLLAGSRVEVSPFTTSSQDLEAAEPSLLADKNVKTDSTPDCPNESDIRDLAAGLLPGDRAAGLTHHAAACDHCGPLLRSYAEDFSDAFSQEERAALEQLGSASPAWLQQTAQKMMSAAGVQTSDVATTGSETLGTEAAPATGKPRKADKTSALIAPPRRSSFWKWALIPATAAACALIAFGVWYRYVRETPEKVEKLLAQAYTERRTLEMRFPGTAYSNYKQTLSGDSESLLNSPESLRQAANLIDSQLKKNPDDPLWLLLSARLNLLDWRYKPALAILDKIQDAEVVDSADMRMTRALALYEQAQWEPERKDQTYGEIINLMGKTLQETPDNSTALFNRALACEKIHAYECAITDYQRFLKQKDQEGWSGEAKDHLNRIEEKKTSGH
jgi:tetratricopeptide (TPR) repeat protein